jgi:hypothetical protein
MTTFAYCHRNGEILIGETLPEGTLEIARGRRCDVERLIWATARLAYDNKTWFVPGVPEAGDNDDAALEAVVSYVRQIRARVAAE